MATITRRGERWRVQIRRARQKPVHRTFASHTEAKRWAVAEEARLDRLPAAPKEASHDLQRVTVGEVIDAYCEYMIPRLNGTSLSNLRMIKEKLGALRLAELGAPRVISYIEGRRAAGISPATAMHDISYLGSALLHGGVFLNARQECAKAKIEVDAARLSLRHARTVDRSKERDRRPTEEELGKLKAAFSRSRVPMWGLILFAVSTAMRMGEITNIIYEDFDRQRRTVVVRGRKHPRRRADEEIPLLKGPVCVLGEVIDPVELIERYGNPERRGRIFPYGKTSVSSIFGRACGVLGIKDLRFHDLRHDAVSRLFEAGYRIEQVALVSGHKTWDQLRRYTKLDPTSLHRDVGG